MAFTAICLRDTLGHLLHRRQTVVNTEAQPSMQGSNPPSKHPEKYLLGMVLFTAIGAVAVEAADFRVQTQIFSEDLDLPMSENTTLFFGGDVYDSVAGGREITLFKTSENTVFMLDLRRRKKTRITTDKLLQYTAWLKEKSAGSKDPLLNFCAAPKFEVRSENQGKSWHFEHPVIRYQVIADLADDREIAEQYRRFCDWYARLNALLRPQSLPPFPRLLVNERLAREELIPKSIELRISPQRRTGDREIKIRSIHTIKQELSAADKVHLQLIDEYLDTFEEVPLAQYRASSQPAEK
jgi:hypothetical protein